MKDLIFVFTLFSSLIYFSFTAILGLDSDEGNVSSFYKFYCIVVFFISILTVIVSFPKRSVNHRQLISLFIISVYILVGLLSGYSDDKSWLCLVAFCLPATCISIYYSVNGKIYKMVKWIDLLILFFAISSTFSVKTLFSNIISGDAFYSQNLSYLAAYCIILNLYMVLIGKQYERFSFFTTKAYKLVSMLMFPYFLAIQLFAGGRGAFGTLVAGILIVIYMYKKRNSIKFGKLVKPFLLISTVSVLLIPLFSSEMLDVFDNNVERVFSFFSTDKDIYQRASGRDVILKAAFRMIGERPILGYGLFSYKDAPYVFSTYGYPHNIFVEVMLQGGICLLVLFLVLIINTFFKLLKICKNTNQNISMLFLVFSLTLLLYSGSYMESSFFWFSFVFAYNYTSRKIKSDVKTNITYFNNVPDTTSSGH